MVCASCGAKIADKAIVCYRCGTATAVPAAPSRPAPRRPQALAVWMSLLLAVAAAVLAWRSADPVWQWGAGAVAVVFIVVTAFLAFRRR